MPSLVQLLSNPLHAALIAAVVTLVVSYIDNRVSRNQDYLIDYLKSMIYTGGLVYAVVYILTNPRNYANAAPLMY